jgi:hypothetical protein
MSSFEYVWSSDQLKGESKPNIHPNCDSEPIELERKASKFDSLQQSVKVRDKHMTEYMDALRANRDKSKG